MPMLILSMGLAEPFSTIRTVHGGRNKVAGIAIGRHSLTRTFRGREMEVLALHRSPSEVVQGYRNLRVWGAPRIIVL
jgi:hypothetical protein